MKRTPSPGLELALGCVAVCLLVAVPAGYALARHPFPGSGLVEELVRLQDLLQDQVEVVAGGPALALLPLGVRNRLRVLERLDQLPDLLAELALPVA